MTPKQISLVERIIPYVEYMLARRIPYVPPRLWDDCRSIAYMSLCEYVAKQDDENASWVSEFAFKRMKDAVIKFLVSEKKYGEDLSIQQVAGKSDEYFKTGEDRISDQADIEVIIASSHKRKNFQEVFTLLKKGYSVDEIARETHIPPDGVRRTIKKMRQDYQVAISHTA